MKWSSRSTRSASVEGLADGVFAEFHRDLFNKCYDFGRKLLDGKLVLPALDYCLKCSHLFNLLDSSGSIGVTERTAYILRVRQFAVAIATAWLADRGAARGVAMDRELLLEIGVEEMPASWLPPLTPQLGERLKARLAEEGFAPKGAVETFSTPRRLTACLAELVDRQEDRDETVMGPPVSAAFDAEGHPTNAGLGFARKLGADFDALLQVETPKGKYLSYQRHIRGRATVDVLPDLLGRVLRDLSFPQVDAVGRPARRWEGRVAVRPSDSVAAVPVRRARGAVHDRAPAARLESARPGRDARAR